MVAMTVEGKKTETGSNLPKIKPKITYVDLTF